MRFQSISYTLLFSVSSVIQRAHAGVGATVHGCVQLSKLPSDNFEVSFSTSGTCMNELGVAGSVNVTQTGVTCAPLGYVESKASSSDGDLCATDYSYWNLAFSGGGLSGSVVSKWDTWKPPAYWFTTVNRISMISSTAPVVFCQSWGWPCDWSTYPDGVDPYIRWDKGDVGDVYIIFRPKV